MASDPWARFDSILQKSKPPDPWARFDSALPGPWEATASPLVQRRRMPDGSYETRPTPREGQEPAVTPADPLRSDTPEGRAWKAALVSALPGAGGLAPGTAAALADVAGETARGIPARIKEGLAAMPELPTLGINFLIPSSPQGRLQADPSDIYGERGGLVRETRESVREGRAAAAERIAEAGVGLPPGVSAWADTTSEAGAAALDPTNWLGVGGAAKVARAGERGLAGAGARVVDDLAEYTAEELAALAARERGLVRLGPEDIARTMPAEPPPVRLGSGIPDAEIEQRLGMRASPEDAEELRRLSLEIGEDWPKPGNIITPPGTIPDSPWSRFDDELARMAPEPSPVPPPLTPAGRVADDLTPRPGLPPRRPEIGAPAGAGEVFPPVGLLDDAATPPPSTPSIGPTSSSRAFDAPPLDQVAPPLRMSTRGIENSTGLQDDLHRVVEANRPELEAARGPVVPVSQWHDAPALAEKLGLAPEDYLRRPADRGPMNADELSLGRHYLGQMKKEALDLEARIAAGDVPDRAAAEAEKVARNRDVVRMMATLQGQGSSENARAMRSLQEALDPYGLADTPRDRVRLALLKKYKEANAGEAARLEAAAVARLKRQAARETRKASRQATAAELSDELGQLAERFGQISRSQIGRGAPGGIVPIDPELVEVVGKMAANRVRAGVVAVEELADQVYTAVARQVDGVSREQVRAAIVEHALAGPAKAQKPPRDPAAAKLRAREQALARQVEKAEERAAAGPGGDWHATASPHTQARRRPDGTTEYRTTPQTPADSPRLQELRQRLDEVRAQLAAEPREGLAARYRELLDDQTIEMIATLPDPAEDPDALLDFLRLMERPTWKDYAGAYVYNNLLSGPKSLLRNVVGNTVKRWDRIAMQPLSAGIEHVLARQQGRLPERYVQEVLPMVVGSYQGAPEALQKGLWVLKNGWDPERVVAELTGVEGSAKYYEGRLPVDPFLLSQNKAVRAFGAVHGYGPRLMQVGDVMARTRNFSSATHAWATRTAINDVKRGTATDVATRAAELLREQPEEMIEYAQRVAREDTFTDEVSNVAKLIGAGRREDTGVGFLLNQTVRFLNVPDRIMAWLGDYTPGLRVAGAAWKGGKLRQAWGTPEASDILARQAFGTALASAAAAWAFQGKLVGNAPRDEKLRNDFYAAGKQPNSVLVGGRWVPIRDLFGGWAGPVVAAAAFHDSAMTGEPVDGEELLQRAGGAALGEARFLLDAGYLSTLSDTVGAIQAEPDQAGAAMTGLATRTAAGALVPWSGLQRNIAIAEDPRVVDKDGPLDEVKAGIPGLRQTLPARIGTLGEELRQGTGAAGGMLPVVPTRNRVANPGLAEDVERLRATLAARRREIGRVEQDIKDARKAKDAARVRELQASLPRGASTARLDNIMESIRVQEMRIRKLRASGKPGDVIRRAEVKIQRRMEERLQAALVGLR